MKDFFVEDKTYSNLDLTKDKLEKGEYYNCIFKNCNFFEEDLSAFVFENCEFIECNLSSVKFINTSLQEVNFKHCKIFAVMFSDANNVLISLNFDNCNLSFSSFFKLKLSGSKFIECNLQEVDFVEADLSNSDFSGSSLYLSIFENTIINKADFRSAQDYNIDLEKNSHIKTRFSSNSLAGLLNKYNIIIE
jgi:uncharacterized protein YjbI with pentapeptide repeats